MTKNQSQGADQFLYLFYRQEMGLIDNPIDDFVREAGERDLAVAKSECEQGKAGEQDNDLPLYKRYSAKAIKSHLDKYVIGQDSAKKALAVVANTHLKRMSQPTQSQLIGKSNLMLIGDTGVGKTLMVSKLAEILNIPFVIEDSNQITKEGYVGRSPTDILLTLIRRAGGDLGRAQYGIVFMDELDKIAQQGGASSADVTTKGVQDSLLKMVEGANFEVSDKSGMATYTINTENILFIGGGAFSGIDEIVKARVNENHRNSIGFSADVKVQKEVEKASAYQSVTVDDLVKFGLTPELCGRMHFITRLQSLDIETLIRIIKEPQDAVLKRFEKRFELDGIALKFTQPALEEIARRCIAHKTGARGLVAMMEAILNEAQFEMPGGDDSILKVTKEYVVKKLGVDG